MKKQSIGLILLNWAFALMVVGIGLINTFWGNDPGFGIFLLVLSFIYMPPVAAMLSKRTGFTIPQLVKILLVLCILWAALGVGELFDKIDLMLVDVALKSN